MSQEYTRAVGQRLRAVRVQQGLSLKGVEKKSNGRWKAVVVGSYERGDSAVAVVKSRLTCGVYSIPAAELLPTGTSANPTGPTEADARPDRPRQITEPARGVGDEAGDAVAVDVGEGELRAGMWAFLPQDHPAAGGPPRQVQQVRDLGDPGAVPDGAVGVDRRGPHVDAVQAGHQAASASSPSASRTGSRTANPKENPTSRQNFAKP